MTDYKRGDYVIPRYFNRGEGSLPIPSLCRVTGQAEDTERGPYLGTLMRWFDHHGEAHWSEFWFFEDELVLAEPPDDDDALVQLELFA